MLTSITTVLGAPPHGCNSTDSRLALKSLCHLLMVDPPNILALNASCSNIVVSAAIFFIHTQNLITHRCSMKTSIFLA